MGGKESKRRRALIRSGLDPEAALAAAAKEFAPVRSKQEKLEAANKAEAKKRKLEKKKEKRKQEKAAEAAEKGEGPTKKQKKSAKGDVDEEEPQEGVLETPKKTVKGDPNLTVFVGQLPFKVDSKMLEDHFLKVGIEEVASVRMLTDKTTNKSRGMAFVQLVSEEDVESALQLHQSELCGRWINVERSTVKSRNDTAAKASKRSDANGKINRNLSVFVAKLPYSATAKSIRDHFELAGVEGIVAVKMLSEKVTNKKGMAFVQLSSEAAVSSALELHESQFGSRTIVVERSKPADQDKDEEAEEE